MKVEKVKVDVVERETTPEIFVDAEELSGDTRRNRCTTGRDHKQTRGSAVQVGTGTGPGTSAERIDTSQHKPLPSDAVSRRERRIDRRKQTDGRLCPSTPFRAAPFGGNSDLRSSARFLIFAK